MKKLISLCLFILLAAGTYSQKLALDEEQPARFSNPAKTIAIVLATTGSALIITGAIIWGDGFNLLSSDPDDERKQKTGTVLVVSGICLVGASVPFFISSRKRRFMSVGIKRETVSLLNRSAITNTSIPSLNLKFSL